MEPRYLTPKKQTLKTIAEIIYEHTANLQAYFPTLLEQTAIVEKYTIGSIINSQVV